MKSIISWTLITVFLCGLGCATTTHRNIQTLREVKIDPKKDYEIDLIRNGKPYRIKTTGQSIESQDNHLVVKQATGEVTIKSGEIQTITKEEGSFGIRGLWIGALSGLVFGGIAAGVAATGGCNGSDIPNCKAVVISTALIGTPVFGGLIGGSTGAAIHKRSVITVSPTINQSGSETRAGLGASANF